MTDLTANPDGMDSIPGLDREIALALIREICKTSPDRTTRVEVAIRLREQARKVPSLASTLYRTARAVKACG